MVTKENSCNLGATTEKREIVVSETNISSRTNHSLSERLVVFGVLAIVALAPLPLGSNRPLPMAALSLFVSLLLISWAILLTLGWTTLHSHTRDLKWSLVGYGCVCLWILVQWSPVIPNELADPVWNSAAKLLDEDIGGRISVNPDATLRGLTNLLVYGAIFWLTFHLTRTSERAWLGIRAIAWIGTAYAIYGIAIYMSGNHWIVIYPKWTYQTSLTSTFVNRNSYATFTGLTLLCAVVIFIRHIAPFLALKHPLKSKIVLIVEEIISKAGLKTFSIIAISIALLLSASRGGVGASTVGLLTFGAIYLAQKKIRWRQFVSLSLAATVTASIIFFVGGDHLSRRLPDNQVQSSLEDRTDIYALTWSAILTSPWKGTGFGTFEDVFPAYRQEDADSLVRWDKAHNTYLENALELGLPATILLNLSIALIAFQCLRGTFARKRDKIIPALGVAATALVGLHSIVDFSLQIPAISILYACIMGIAVSQSWSNRNSR